MTPMYPTENVKESYDDFNKELDCVTFEKIKEFGIN